MPSESLPLENFYPLVRVVHAYLCPVVEYPVPEVCLDSWQEDAIINGSSPIGGGGSPACIGVDVQHHLGLKFRLRIRPCMYHYDMTGR